MNTARIADQIAQVERDLAEVGEQVEAGELDEAIAERLRVAYRIERATLERQLTEAEEANGEAVRTDRPALRSRGRAVAGILVVGVAGIVVAVIAVFSLQERTSVGEATDGVATAVLESGEDRDTGTVGIDELEAFVARDPEASGFRLVLADRYVEIGEYSKALEQYMAVLEQEPENVEALARVGWLTFLSDEAELAEPFVVRAIALEPEYSQAYWYLANIYVELGDMNGAIESLEQLLTFELPVSVRTQAEQMLAEARS